MQLLIIIPKQPNSTGNHVTANRFAATLPEHNWLCHIIETGPDHADEINTALKINPPDAVLLLHAYRAGRSWLRANNPANLPMAVLMTGTDYNHDQQIPERAAIIEQIHQQAAAIIIQNRLLFQQFYQIQTTTRQKFQLLPPGIRLGKKPFPLRSSLQLDDQSLLFLHPAGIRPVKGNLELLLRCEHLAAQQTNFQLAFCGPPLDNDYIRDFLAALEKRPWAHYLGEIPECAIADAMQQADVVLNNSSSEGISNALVEAASLGRPILASDIVGNRAIVQHNSNGLLYANQEQFNEHAGRLINDPELRQRLSKPQPCEYSAQREGALLATILNQVLASSTKQERVISS